MTCNPLTLNVSEGWFIKATDEIKRAGGSVQGDAGSGEFSVPVPKGIVVGNYMVVASKLQITITQRPFWLLCALIESFVRQRLGKE